MNSNKGENQLEIGWKEWVCLPDLLVPAIKAKIDTGARTSALHAFYLQTFRKHNSDMVEFHIHPLQRKKNIAIICIAPVLDKRIVRDSGGHEEERYVIMTNLRLGNRQWPIEITLTNRDDMLFRMLLGRTALHDRNIAVNPDKFYLTGRSLSKVYRRALSK